ncbi:ATP synthase F1 subunit delta [Galbibacter sp.]|jgi:F-type H+-transporting ATPase subunit delta|uniref:ATP synthase F1 subunit delta n=1 Tax=Galbibacter sp. TaxID=2918471 RepID=UPI003A914A8C
MKGTRAGLRYAKAVLAHAKEQHTLEEVNQDMESIFKTIQGSSELQYMLQSPVIKLADKKAALTEIFSGMNVTTEGLIGILVENNRINLLGAIAEKYSELYDALRGEQAAIVTTAVPLTGELEKKVLLKVQELTGKKAVLENKIDPTIIGGFVLRVGDLQYNASVANQLNNLKRDLLNNSFVA